MTIFVALLRGINVGGHNILPMQDFRELLTTLGCVDVATYIQSGNAVFRHTGGSDQVSASISASIESDFGFRPPVMVLTADEFRSIVAANPFQAIVSEPKLQHIMFMREPATKPNMQRMNEIAANGEEFLLAESAFYLHAPNGIGRSKLAAEAEKCLGVQATGRNWRTVCKIVSLLDALQHHQE